MTDQAGSRIGESGAYDVGGLTIGVAGPDDVLVGRQRRGLAARPGQPVVRREQLLDVAGDPDLRVDQDDEVVADPLEVGDHVRGEQHADLVLGDRLHQDLQELAAGQRVQARDRLVEDQQLGPLRQPEGQGELGALAAGELAGLLPRVEAEPLDPAPGDRVVPARVEVRTEAQVVGDREPGVGRGVLRDEADLRQLGRVGGRAAAADLDRARRSGSACRRSG